MFRKLLLVLAAGVVAALFLQCGTPKTCNTTNCPNGCCDSTSTCVAGTAASACGDKGNSCVACSGTQTCNATTKVCSGGSTGGGSGGSTGGGTGSTGGGTGGSGGSTGGGAGGSTGGGTGGAGGGSSSGQNCNIVSSPTCPNGQFCQLVDVASAGTGAGKCRPGCNPVAQDCSGAGQKCTYVQNGTVLQRACVDAGTLTEDTACSAASDQCGSGLLCIARGSGMPTLCTKYCQINQPTTCNANHSCSTGFPAVTMPASDLEFQTLCNADTQACNLINQDCANTAQACIQNGGSTICITPGTSAIGTACASATACVKGGICINTGTPTCLKLCNLDGGSPNCTGVGSGTCGVTSPALVQSTGVCQ